MKQRTESKTIKQWIKRRDKAIANGTINVFKEGIIMPIVGETSHLTPKGRGYLFDIRPGRYPLVIDRNHQSVFRCGKWRTVERSEHKVYVVSVAVAHGRNLQWLKGPSDVVEDYILPEGWHWRKDDLGYAAVDPDGHDYHPYWSSDITVDDIIRCHAYTKQQRKKREGDDRAWINHKIEQFKGTLVLLEDSRRAGNCVAGSLEFARQRLGIEPEDILTAPFLYKVAAERLIKTKNERALEAVRCAYERETTIAI